MPAITDPALDAQVETILARLSPAERLGQLAQVKIDEPGLEDLVAAGQVGSVILVTSATAGNDRQERVMAQRVDALQRIAIERSPHGIPLLAGRDVIHGHCTVFPIPLGQAASWDPSLTELGCAITAREAAADGVHWTFAPMMDIARDPRWGRIAEGYGEDPVLATAFAVAAVRGFQGPDPAEPGRLGACAKHFVGYGAAEGGRDYNTCEIGTNTLRNIYLPPFQAVVEAGVVSFMSAFHDLSGTPISANRPLLTGVLRDEWGFRGLVVSDWDAVNELIHHGRATDQAEAARLALSAGIDLEMVSTCYHQLPAEVAAGRLDQAVIDEACRRVLRTKLALGLFARPYRAGADLAAIHLAPAHLAAARDAARAGIVLLKNVGILPLDPARVGRIGVFGPMAHERQALFGSWTLDGTAEAVTTFHDALAQRLPGKVVTHTQLDDAMKVAKWCDLVVLAVGESPARSGEDNCVSDLGLPPGQGAWIEAFARIGIPVVTVVIAGRPLVLTEAERASRALVFTFHPGTEGGHALAEVLTGAVEPRGRLPVSFPRSTGQVPIHYNRKRTGRPQDVRDPRQTRYNDGPSNPRWPFGFGLGYTTFAYADLTVSPESGSVFTITATVRNTGSRAGHETVQLYLRDVAASATRPERELKAWKQVHLEPGASQTVSFTMTAADLAFWTGNDRWEAEPGRFLVWVGPDAEGGLEGAFTYQLA